MSILIMAWSIVNGLIVIGSSRGSIYCKTFLLSCLLAVWTMFIVCHNYKENPSDAVKKEKKKIARKKSIQEKKEKVE